MYAGCDSSQFAQQGVAPRQRPMRQNNSPSVRLPGEDRGDVNRILFPCTPTTFLLALVYVDFLAVLLALGLGFAWHQDPTAYTGEGDPITWLSFAHLLVTSGIAGGIFYWRTGGSRDLAVWRHPAFVWLLIALGFLFLAVDEVAKIHESLDHFVHRLLHRPETGLTDRLDDAILLGYGSSGVAVLYVYRSELTAYRPVLPLVMCGFALVNRPDVFLSMGISQEGSASLGKWFGGVEEGLKILAEAAFLGTAYTGLFLTHQAGFGRNHD